MTSTSNNPWLHRFAVLTAGCTLFLIWVGGLVTSHGAGMAVPDWPTTYGYNMFFFPFSQWIGGIFYEHSHRLVASIVGMLTAILAGWIWARETSGWPRRIGLFCIVLTLGLMGVRTQGMFLTLAVVAAMILLFCVVRLAQDERKLRWLAAIAFCTVLIQGVLGGLRVTAMKNEIGVFHGTLAQMFFALLCTIALVTSRWWRRSESGQLTVYAKSRLRYVFLSVTGLILVQLILGATMRHQHAGLAIPDFPLAYGKVWPDMDPDSVTRYNQARGEITATNPITAFQIGLQMVHRITAVAILIAVAWVTMVAGRRLGWGSGLARLSLGWLALIVFQAGLGAATIWTNKAADFATAHVVGGALSLVTGLSLALITASVPESRAGRPKVEEALYSLPEQSARASA